MLVAQTIYCVLVKQWSAGRLTRCEEVWNVESHRKSNYPTSCLAHKEKLKVSSKLVCFNKATKTACRYFSVIQSWKFISKFNMSFINEFTFHNFLSFGFQIDWVYKSHLYNQTKSLDVSWRCAQRLMKLRSLLRWNRRGSAFYRGVYQLVLTMIRRIISTKMQPIARLAVSLSVD